MKNKTGFTIVELLIVIVVVAILATISIVAYNGVQERAKNTARVSTGNDWVKLFQLYQAQFGTLPPQITEAAVGARFCLGTDFPIGGGGVARCQNVVGTDINSPIESDNTALMTELKKVGQPPLAKPIPTATRFTGPYIVKNTASEVRIVIGVDGSNYTIGTECESGFTTWYTDHKMASCYKSVYF